MRPRMIARPSACSRASRSIDSTSTPSGSRKLGSPKAESPLVASAAFSMSSTSSRAGALTRL